MATSTIDVDIIYYRIPYSSFTWNDSTKSFDAPNPLPSGKTLLGFLISPTNGTAIMQGYLNSSNLLRVFGWIPSIGGSITNSYVFECYAILR